LETLPAEFNADKSEATVENGALTLTIPKSEKPKQVQIQPKAK
jgi:HSP20 family molecular chaperone IbpA